MNIPIQEQIETPYKKIRELNKALIEKQRDIPLMRELYKQKEEPHKELELIKIKNYITLEELQRQTNLNKTTTYKIYLN